MGDALRNELGIGSGWTRKDINNYQSISLPELGSVYLIENIPKDSPADRARYLDLKLRIEDGGKEEKKIIEISQKHSKALALRALEKIAIKRFF